MENKSIYNYTGQKEVSSAVKLINCLVFWPNSNVHTELPALTTITTVSLSIFMTKYGHKLCIK